MMGHNNKVIIVNLKSEPRSRLINRIPGSCLLISSLQDSALRLHGESLGRAFKIQHEYSKPCLVLDIRRLSLSIFYIQCRT